MKTLPALACLLLLAGCIGYPPGAVRPGDEVTLRYTATDPATGAVLEKDATLVAVAGRASGLGPDVDRALLGHKVNETFAVDATSAVGYTGRQEVPRDLGSSEMENRVPRSAFEAQLGPAKVGQSFRASSLYNATVVAVDDGNVTYRLDVQDGEEIPIPSLGLKVVHYVNGTTLVRTLGPLPGATFGLAPTPSGQTPLGLPAGSYRTRGVEGDNLVYDYSPMAPALFGKALHIEAKVTAVQPGERPAAPTGEYGHRSSPQVRGDPSIALPTTS
ncbi:MAG: hypothetical protein LC623_05535 [Halobacteriales archaeon]|nr:hypothetical protein [Halobacteriales archaeon]